MKIIDCITYFNEPLLFELRLNILDKFVDEFIVCEARYTHAGEKKNLNFNINDFKKFEKKINYIIIDNEPKDLVKTDYIVEQENSIFRTNAQKRIFHQREAIFNEVKKNKDDDWVIYSDSDEIPNFEKFDLKKCKNKFVLFNQKLLYYKFDLIFLLFHNLDHKFPLPEDLKIYKLVGGHLKQLIQLQILQLVSGF